MVLFTTLIWLLIPALATTLKHQLRVRKTDFTYKNSFIDGAPHFWLNGTYIHSYYSALLTSKQNAVLKVTPDWLYVCHDDPFETTGLTTSVLPDHTRDCISEAHKLKVTYAGYFYKHDEVHWWSSYATVTCFMFKASVRVIMSNRDPCWKRVYTLEPPINNVYGNTYLARSGSQFHLVSPLYHTRGIYFNGTNFNNLKANVTEKGWYYLAIPGTWLIDIATQNLDFFLTPTNRYPIFNPGAKPDNIFIASVINSFPCNFIGFPMEFSVPHFEKAPVYFPSQGIGIGLCDPLSEDALHFGHHTPPIDIADVREPWIVRMLETIFGWILDLLQYFLISLLSAVLPQEALVVFLKNAIIFLVILKLTGSRDLSIVVVGLYLAYSLMGFE